MSKLTVSLNKNDLYEPWGFRLVGGANHGQALMVQKVTPGGLAAQKGLQAGDLILKISGHDTESMSHQEAQDTIMKSGNHLELAVQRGGTTTWRPTVTPVGDANPSARLIGEPTPLTKTSLAANRQDMRPIGSGHNKAAKPFNASMPALVHKQYNSPLNIYSETNIAETLQAHSEVLATGVKGINFMKPDAPINTQSPVYQMVQEEEEMKAKGYNSAPPPSTAVNGGLSEPRGMSPIAVAANLRHVEAPVSKPPPEHLGPQELTNQNVCSECGRLIVGVFVRVKDKSLHAECFRCGTCGTSLKNAGYFNINDRLYCDIHAKQVASLMSTSGQILPVPVLSENKLPVLSAPANIDCPQQSTPIFQTMNIKIPPATAPKPPNNPPWIGASTIPGPGIAAIPGPGIAAIPGPGIAGIPGSRPGPRRGRGILKLQSSAGSIPICSKCGSPIRGPYIAALGKTWCAEHFLCNNIQCKRSLQDVGFIEEKGELYCEVCYEMYLAPICAKCNVRIKESCLNALEKQWHPECFICAYCKRPFGNSSFYMEDGLPYCEKDWNELFQTRCAACNFAIEAGDRWVEALNQNYHSQCFKCAVCHKSLENQGFFAKGGRPFCKSHARQVL